jgi:hypothetical protein
MTGPSHVHCRGAGAAEKSTQLTQLSKGCYGDEREQGRTRIS